MADNNAKPVCWKKQGLVLHPPEIPSGVSMRAKVMWRGPTSADVCIATAAVPLSALRYGPAAIDAELRLYGNTAASRKVAANAGVSADAGRMGLVAGRRAMQQGAKKQKVAAPMAKIALLTDLRV